MRDRLAAVVLAIAGWLLVVGCVIRHGPVKGVKIAEAIVGLLDTGTRLR